MGVISIKLSTVNLPMKVKGLIYKCNNNKKKQFAKISTMKKKTKEQRYIYEVYEVLNYKK